jgi:hypothetical protein
LTRVVRRASILLAVIVQFWSQTGHAQTRGAADFPSLIDDILRHTATGIAQSSPPTENDLKEWKSAFGFFRAHALDSCRRILARYNYALLQVQGGSKASSYDVIMERTPVRRGWGTYICNRNPRRRVYVEVQHPLRDEKSANIGAELFRKLDAEWLMIAGTDRSGGFSDDDFVRLNEKLFQKWHEMLTDLVHVTLSVHTFPARSYPHPIDMTDVVVGNGRTSDEQWGISEISLGLRDTIRAARLSCSLAMYDSGYARFSGAGSREGTFSNDSVGFGHWLNLELSDRISGDPARTSRLIAAVDRALDVTGQKISREIQSFGLVSPRVLRLDPGHRVLFPPAADEKYQIISFDSREVKHDTVVIRVGDWVDLHSPAGAASAISELDARKADLIQEIGSRSPRGPRREIAKIVERPPRQIPRTNAEPRDSSSGGDNDPIDEPLQVHRIPLEPLLASTVSADYLSGVTPFRWQGAIASGFSPAPRVFAFGTGESISGELSSPANLLIPIMNSSYNPTGARFVGVQMTAMLVNQITRLADAAHNDRDITLLAERDEQGRFFLRIFPGRASRQEGEAVRQ